MFFKNKTADERRTNPKHGSVDGNRINAQKHNNPRN